MKKIMPILALAMIVAIVGCSDKKTTNPNPIANDSTTVWVNDTSGTYWRSIVDGSSYSSFKYFSFGKKDTISITDSEALTDTSWDIAFRRTVVKTNSGISGIKNVRVANLAMAHSPDSINFNGVTDTTGIRDRDWISDSYAYAVGDWYTYDQMHHTMDLTNYVYTLKDAEGKYVKFTVSGLYGGGMPPNMGNIVIRYVYAASGTDISGVGETDTIIVGADTAYFDFSSGETVTPADPSSSLDWDFAIAAYDIHLNSSMFGIGQAAAYLNTDSLGNPRTDFDNIAQAETQPTAYFQDAVGSAFTEWYDYNENTHQLTSKGHVYLVRVGANIYKMQISSYYANVNGTPTSGWYTFKWLKLDL
jgi:hypothetical protein